MTARAVSHGATRLDAISPLFLWLLACAFMMFMSASAIANWSFPDPDDVMRLLEVRNWIAGQSWFDVTQYRLNGPAGVPMHWSRLVDVPIAAVILVARPFVGAARAEMIAIVSVPLITLGIAMFLVHRIALKLMTSRAALAAVAATPLSLGAMKQMRPMRVDHHGWQIVMALVGLLACFDERPRRSGIVAGVAMAVWLNISLEGLPYAATIGLLFAVQWLRDSAATQRFESYLAALAGASILLFAGTHEPSTWLTQPHDVVTAAYLAGFATASVCIALAVRAPLEQRGARLAALGVAGILTLSAMFLVDPHWMSGPFSSLDPLVRRFWYQKVDEGLPMWQIDRTEAAIALAQPIVGLVGACTALLCCREEARERWGIYLFILLSITVSSLTVLRIATTASVLAMPATAFLCQLAFRRARRQSLAAARVISTTAAIFVMAPAYAVPASFSTADPRLERAVASGEECVKGPQVSKLDILPHGEIAAPLDITPAILLHTTHDAIATGHHRNVSGMRDVIRLFIEPPASGEAIIRRRHVDYVVLCPGAPESIRFARTNAQGLAAGLLFDKAPRWLEPTQVPGLTTLKVWRVRKDLL